EEEFGKTPVGFDAGEDLFVLDLTGHDGAVDAFSLEGFDELGKFAQGEPVDRDCADLFDFWKGLFFNGSDDDVEALCASSIHDEERKFSVASDEAEFFS